MQADPRVEQWLRRFIVGERICPFAQAPLEHERIRIVQSDAREPEAMVEVLVAELTRLLDVAPEALETTLLVLPEGPVDFLDFLDWHGLAEAVIEAGGWEGIFQVVAFHPAFQYADEPADAAGNWTNRSPLPLLHLLREQSIEAAGVDEASGLAIADRNRAHLEAMDDPRRVAWGDDPP